MFQRVLYTPLKRQYPDKHHHLFNNVYFSSPTYHFIFMFWQLRKGMS